MINIINKLIVEHQVKVLSNASNHITNALEMQTLFINLKKYEDVFSIENADKLLMHEDNDHAIEIITKSLYESLYNLSNTELVTLRQYLNDVLMKR